MKTEAIVGGNKAINFEEDNRQLFMDGQPIRLNVEPSGSDIHIISHRNKSYEVELISNENDIYTLKVDGQYVDVEILDQNKQILKQLGFDTAMADQVNEILSPMPGTIIEIHCQEGQAVSKGDSLIILEAMKMENVIKAPGDGLISKVTVEKGDNVEKNQTLVVF